MIALVAAVLVPMGAALLLATAGRVRPGWCGPAAALATAIPLPLVALAAASRAGGEVRWFDVGPLLFTVGLRADGLGGATALLVAAISAAVTVYAVAYMQGQEGRPRFFAWMCLFEGAMLALVLADSLVVLFFGWEAVGVASWALIAHEHRRPEARRAGAQAFLVTRAGDLAMLAALAWTALATGSTRTASLLAAAQAGALGAATAPVALLFLAAALSKSAQLPASAWLPDAMAGPTPVSALLHSATMAAAGVFLVVRLWPLFAAVPAVLTGLAWVGAATALTGALLATAADDLKRILAWSTVDQLGLMMLALGLGGPLAAVLQLFAHACFKAALFLAAGAIDEATGHRELSRLGGLARALPWTAAGFAAAGLSLAGIPPLAGFWSAESILSVAARRGGGWAALVVLVTALAGWYVARAWWGAFGRWPRGGAQDVRRAGWGLRLPVVLLAAAAVAGGAVSPALERMLGLAVVPEAPTAWRWAALAAAAVGLAGGALRVRRAGPAAVLGRWPAAVEAAVAALVAVWRPVGTVAAAATERVEDALGRAAAGVATVTASAARGVDADAEQGLARGGDRLGAAIVRAGGGAVRAQTGKLYLYTSAAAIFVAAALAAAAVAWIVAAPPVRAAGG